MVLTADHDGRIVADIVAEWAHRHWEPYFAATCLTPSTGRTLRRLGDLAPTTLALMHGPSYAGDGAEQLRGLADAYDERLDAAGPVLHAPVQRPEADGSTSRLVCRGATLLHLMRTSLSSNVCRERR